MELHGAWETVGAVLPSMLVETRVGLHWAAQVASAAGATLLPPKEDASHTSLGWDHHHRALLTHPLAAKGARVGLTFRSIPQILIVGADGENSIGIEGRTVDELLAWLAEKLLVPTLKRPEHPLPPFQNVEAGGRFPKLDPRAVDELARWFGNAESIITKISSTNANASAVRCWPHHFDIASLITVKPETTIGVGMSPGDATYEEPYFYVTPWPYPTRGTTLPALRSGQWHVEGWTGAVLRGGDLVHASSAATDDEAIATTQRAIGEPFLSDCVASCEMLLA